MPVDKARIDDVARRIESAFAAVDYPGDDRMLHPDCMDDMDIAAYYGSTSWRDLPAETIAFENAALSFASAAGFQFLLPAYMIWTLRNIDDGDVTVEHTLYSLDPKHVRHDLRDFQISKYALLTAEQRAAILAFLGVLADDPHLGSDAKAALDNHWRSER